MKTEYKNLDFPWRKAWKLDDPEWVKQRKKRWSQIKKSPVFQLYRKSELREAKIFFLTGLAYFEEELHDEYNPNHPGWRYRPDTRPLVVPGGCL